MVYDIKMGRFKNSCRPTKMTLRWTTLSESVRPTKLNTRSTVALVTGITRNWLIHPRSFQFYRCSGSHVWVTLVSCTKQVTYLVVSSTTNTWCSPHSLDRRSVTFSPRLYHWGSPWISTTHLWRPDHTLTLHTQTTRLLTSSMSLGITVPRTT